MPTRTTSTTAITHDPVPHGELFVGFVNVLHQVDNTLDVRSSTAATAGTGGSSTSGNPADDDAGAWDCSMSTSAARRSPSGTSITFSTAARRITTTGGSPIEEGLTVPEALSKSEVEYALGLAKMRKDGFVSLDAGAVREGVLMTARCGLMRSDWSSTPNAGKAGRFASKRPMPMKRFCLGAAGMSATRLAATASGTPSRGRAVTDPARGRVGAAVLHARRGVILDRIE